MNVNYCILVCYMRLALHSNPNEGFCLLGLLVFQED
jgi:hypothetical protein